MYLKVIYWSKYKCCNKIRYNELKGAYYDYSTDEDNVGKLNGQKASQFSDETKAL